MYVFLNFLLLWMHLICFSKKIYLRDCNELKNFISNLSHNSQVPTSTYTYIVYTLSCKKDEFCHAVFALSLMMLYYMNIMLHMAIFRYRLLAP